MNAKDNIINLDAARLADNWCDNTLKIVEGIQVKADRIEHRKLDTEAGDRLSPEVVPSLRVETQRPEKEADPAARRL
jgi:hypothetical protein